MQAATWAPVSHRDPVYLHTDGTTSGATRELLDTYIMENGENTVSALLFALLTAEEFRKRQSPDNHITEAEIAALVYASPEAKITVTKFDYDNSKANFELHRDMIEDENGKWVKTIMSVRRKTKQREMKIY